MNILIFVQNYPPERGAVRYTYDLANELALRGHHIHVVTVTPHYPIGRAYPGYSAWRPCVRVKENVRVTRVPTIMGNNRQLARRMAGFLAFLPIGFIAASLRSKPDIIVASVPPPTIACLGFLLGRIWRVPVVQLLRDVEPHVNFGIRGLEKKFVARMLIRLANKMYRSAAKVVVVEPGHASLLHGIVPQERLAVIPRGIDVDRFQNRACTPSDVLPAPKPGRKLAVYMGTMGVVHDTPRVVRALTDPQLRTLPLDLVFIGDGECAMRCRQIVEEHHLTSVSIKKPVPLSQVPAILRQADLLLGTFRDGTTAIGAKVCEYFAAGKPVLIVGKCEAGDLVERVGSGWACASPAPSTLFEALRAFLEDPVEAERRGARGLDYVREHFDAGKCHDQWEDVLHELKSKVPCE